MAYELVEKVLQDRRLRPGPRLVLVVLAAHASRETMKCWPGIRRLMDMTGMGERTVLKAVEWLRRQGYIRTAKNRSAARTNLYTLLPNEWPKPSPETCKKGQIKPAEFDISDMSSGQHNLSVNMEEGTSKRKAKVKTCDKSQEKYVKNSSKAMGKGGKAVQVQDEREQKNEMDMESKNIGISSPTKLRPTPPPRTGTSKLARLWIEHAARQDVTVCLTAREGKMLRDAAQKIEYGNLNLVVPMVIADWKAFTDFCRREGVAFTMPKTPQVAFFVKFVDKAYEFIKRRQRKAELLQQKEKISTHLLQLLAKRDELRCSIAAEATTPLTMPEKKNIMGVDSRHIERWEAVFGPITPDFLNPGFEPNSFYDEFRADPKIKLPDPAKSWVDSFRKYVADLQRSRISYALTSDAQYRALNKEIDEMEHDLKTTEWSILEL